MDITEPTEPTPAPVPSPELVLTADAKYFLHTAGRWANFLGIMGFIGTGILAIIGIFAGTMTTILSRFDPAATAMPTSGFAGMQLLVLLPMVLLYFFISYYIYQFGIKIKLGISLNDTALATNAFQNLKSHLKLIGITTIVVIALYILIIIGVIIFAANIGSGMR